MTRDEINDLLKVVADIESELAAIKNAIYSTDEDYDDLVLGAMMALEKVAENFADTVKYLDEQLLLQELDTGEEE